MSAPRIFRLLAPVSAVKLQDHPGSRLRSPTETLIKIPADTMVEIEGVLSPSGLVTIVWEGDAYSVLYEDLEQNGRVVGGAVQA